MASRFTVTNTCVQTVQAIAHFAFTRPRFSVQGVQIRLIQSTGFRRPEDRMQKSLVTLWSAPRPAWSGGVQLDQGIAKNDKPVIKSGKSCASRSYQDIIGFACRIDGKETTLLH
jgi:hypothetical protein